MELNTNINYLGLVFLIFRALYYFHYHYYFLFSEYRAELYSRLETRRMKKLTRENRKAESDKQRSQPLKERKVKKKKRQRKPVIE